MIIFSVAQGENAESDKMTFDLTQAYMGITPEKEPVKVYRYGHEFDCIVIKDISYGMKIAAQYNQPFVLVRHPDKSWHAVCPRTEDTYRSWPGFYKVTEEFLVNWSPKLYIKANGKFFVPRKEVK